MPLSRDSPSASVARAAMVGASSPPACRSASIAETVPVPVTLRTPSRSSTAAPIRVSRSRSRSPGWVVRDGQFGTRTVPPAATAAARNGPALERSGSTTTSPPAIGPGSTRHRPGVWSSTLTPRSRSVATVMSMCGRLGSAPPTCRSVSPSANRGAASSRAETNWEDPEASTDTSDPLIAPVPWTVNGREVGAAPPSVVTRTPRSSRARITGAIGRTRAPASPSSRTGPSARAASGGTNRITVPASPQSIWAGPRRGAGRTRSVVPPSSSSMCVPRARNAAIIRSVSRERRAPRIVVGASARAARGSARFVNDFEPGTSTTAPNGADAQGAGQGSALRVGIDTPVSLLGHLRRRPWPPSHRS